MPVPIPEYSFNNRLPKGSVLEFKILEFGGVLRGSLGGPDQSVKRLGDRFQVTVHLPTTEGRLAGDWVGNRAFGYARGGVLRLILPQMVDVKDCGRPTVIQGAGTGGCIVYLDPATAGLYQNGQLFSYYNAGVGSYNLHMVTEFKIDQGFPSIGIAPALRGDPIGWELEFGDPLIEGFMGGIEFSIDQKRFVGQAFTITEWS